MKERGVQGKPVSKLTRGSFSGINLIVKDNNLALHLLRRAGNRSLCGRSKSLPCMKIVHNGRLYVNYNSHCLWKNADGKVEKVARRTEAAERVVDEFLRVSGGPGGAPRALRSTAKMTYYRGFQSDRGIDTSPPPAHHQSHRPKYELMTCTCINLLHLYERRDVLYACDCNY